jgi:predicted transposase YbfD/YdcC
LTETTHGQVFTLDALHCQKQTTTLITKYKNDYIIPLKRNPKKLFKAAVKISESQLSLSESQTVDISHGSQIVRKVSVFDIEPLKSADFDGSQSSQIRSLVKVETRGTLGRP